MQHLPLVCRVAPPVPVYVPLQRPVHSMQLNDRSPAYVSFPTHSTAAASLVRRCLLQVTAVSHQQRLALPVLRRLWQLDTTAVQ